MFLIEILLGIEFLGAAIFYGFITYERTKQDIPANVLQVIVAFAWWIWLPWYVISVLRDKLDG